MSAVPVLAVILIAILLISAISAIRALVYVWSGRQALDDRLRSVSRLTR